MRVHVGEPERKDMWVVEVKGYSGDVDARHVVEAYSGPSLETARRVHLEALALARAFPYGRGGREPGYAKHLTAAGATSKRGAICSWAAECWQWDEMGGAGDATIEGSAMTRYDEFGCKRPVDVELEGPERELLKSVKPFDKDELGQAAGQLMALIEAWEISQATPAGAAAPRKPAL